MTRERGNERPHILMIDANCDVPTDRRMWLQCRALRAAGMDVTVVCPAARSRPGVEVVEGVTIHRYRTPADTGRPTGYLVDYPVSWLRTARLVWRVWRQNRFDLIQACNPPDTYFLIARMFRRYGVRFVFDEADLCPEIYRDRFGAGWPGMHRLLVALERWSHRTAEQVMTVNDSCRGLLLARTGSDPARVAVVRTGADLQRLRRTAPEDELRNGRTYLCAYLGVMGPQDGVDMVVRASHVIVHEFGRSDVQFVLMGDGEERERLAQLAAELDVEPYLTFTGFADDATISACLSTADIGLQPDRRTPFTELCSMIKAIEYMAFDLPFVAVDLCETRRTADGAAVLIRDESPVGFATAICELLDDPERRSRLGTLGGRRSRDELSWDRNRAVYVNLIRSALAAVDVTRRSGTEPRRSADTPTAAPRAGSPTSVA